MLHEIMWILTFSSFLQTNECKESVAATATTVLSCPSNAKEWDERWLKKGCSQIKQTCSSFEYHCVVNSWLNETIEVCAPGRNIVGKRRSYYFYLKFVSKLFSKCVNACFFKEIHIFPGKACAEYNSGGKTIQRNFKVCCKECPVVYSSVHSFLCKWLKLLYFVQIVFSEKFSKKSKCM